MLLLFDFFIISGSKVLVRWVVFRERRKCWMFKVCVSLVPPCAQRFLALFGINKKYLWPCEAHRNQSINQSKLYLPHHFIKNSRPVQSHLHTDIHTYINFILQGAKKVIFTPCLNVISGSPQNVLMSRIDFTVLLYVEFLKILHLPVGQVKNRIH